MFNVKNFCLLFTLCLLPLMASAEGNKGEEKFVVGTTSAYAPYVSLNEKGEYEGFDIDLANIIAQRLKKKLVLQDLGSMPSLLVALQKKKINAIIWAMSITEDRRKEMDMIYYQGDKVTEMPFVFWKEVPKGVQKIEDLSKLPNSTICVEAGSYQDSVLREYPSLKVEFVDKVADSIMKLKYGKAFTATLDNSLVNRVQTQYPEAKVLNLPLPESQQSFGNGICINKTDSELSAAVNKIIADLTAEGKIAELEKKWGLAK